MILNLVEAEAKGRADKRMTLHWSYLQSVYEDLEMSHYEKGQPP
jgi:hypothetical protein